MDFNASGLLLSLSDLFVVMLPGLTMLVLGALIFHNWQDGTFRHRLRNWSGAGFWSIALVSSFLAGHFISQIGSVAEDLYWERHKTDIQEEETELRELVMGRTKTALHTNVTVTYGNVRRWAAVLVRHRVPSLGERLDRADVERRLFRNLAVVFWIGALLAVVRFISVYGKKGKDKHIAAAMAIVLIVLGGSSVNRYLTEGRQFTKEIFENFIASGIGTPEEMQRDTSKDSKDTVMDPRRRRGD